MPRLAVSGARGRLGRAIMAAAEQDAIAWSRPDLDLDDPASLVALVERDRPALVVHAAAMTDVDACARDPELALRRNGAVVGPLAHACHGAGVGLVLISTNEVFDGDRLDGRGYGEDDPTRPRNPYGASKRAGEVAALEAFVGAPGLWIVRTAWLYGPPGNDFPDKIVAAADRLPPDEPLPVVADEHGSPTSVVDVAAALLELATVTTGGIFHLVDTGVASRLAWAERVLAERRPGRAVRPISRDQFERASDPPPWGVLDSGKASVAGIDMRPWETALADYLSSGRPNVPIRDQPPPVGLR
jgi:dTDP-4-dehydrorhamnose reductase